MANKIYKGTLENVILKLIKENKKMYGYEITKQAKNKTNGGFDITEGALYTALHKLESDGVLEVDFKEVNGRARKYYSLTEKGEKEAVYKIEELKVFIENLSIFMNPKLT